jgi:hypothetical protein
MVEIKIGIQDIARELSVETESTAAEVEKDLAQALADGGLLTLKDEKGRRVLVPVAKIAYLDLGQEKARTVGFGAF